MEYLLRRLSIVFILCMLAIILMFVGINYHNDKNMEKSNDKKIERVIKNKKNSKKKKKENSTKKEEISEKSSEETDNDYIDSVNEYKENLESNYTQPSYVNNTNIKKDSTIYVSKFTAKISNNRLYVGQKARIITTIYPSNATIKDTSYQSTNQNIAVVSSNGEVTAISKGECYIIISVKNANSGKLKIRVVENNNKVFQELKDERIEQEEVEIIKED